MSILKNCGVERTPKFWFYDFLLIQGGSTSGTTPLFIVFLCVMSAGTVLMCFLSKRNNKEEEDPQASPSFYSSIISLAKASGSLLLNKRVLLVIPLILYSGLQQAFVWYNTTLVIYEIFCFSF